MKHKRPLDAKDYVIGPDAVILEDDVDFDAEVHIFEGERLTNARAAEIGEQAAANHWLRRQAAAADAEAATKSEQSS